MSLSAIFGSSFSQYFANKKNVGLFKKLKPVGLLGLFLSAQLANSAEFTVYGPEPFSRQSGSPVPENRALSGSYPNTSYTLKIYNGGITDDENTGEMVSASTVSFNGEIIANTSNFNQNVSLLEAPVTLLSDQDNALDVELWGKPSGLITVVIVGLDNDLPVITASLQPLPNGAGWNHQQTQVVFNCSDAISGIASCADPIAVLQDGANQTFSGTAVDNAGNTAAITATVHLDSTAPTLTYQLTPSANTAGWHAQAVTIDYTCTDTLSGVANCPASTLVSTEGAAQQISALAEDIAGNTISENILLNIDLTLPDISMVKAPAPNVAGWNNTAVTVSYTCTDAISGVEVCPPDAPVTEEGEVTITGSASDYAGNTASALSEVKIDNTAPDLSVALSAVANSNGWHNQPVTLSYACSDILSGMAICPPNQLISGSGANQQITATAEDIAGNIQSISTAINIDLEAPSIAFVNPLDGGAVSTYQPTISLAVADNLNLDDSSLQLTVNGASPAVGCTVSGGTGSCSFSADLPSSSVSLEARIADLAGNVTQAVIAVTVDTDADGIHNDIDQCAGTPAGETADSNGCGYSQRDDDNDGVGNALDQCQATPAGEAVDATGCPVNQDLDNDGVLDNVDQCLATQPGIPVAEDGCDPSQRDTDADGVLDINDAFPNDANETADLDGDGIGDNADTDRDGDGVLNADDLFPNDSGESADLDGDGIGDNADPDKDGDGVPNDQDAFPEDSASSALPVITIDTPATLTTVGATPVHITGTAEGEPVSLSVNGAQITAADGTFQADVSLEEGHNTIVARMVNAEGVISTASISVSLDLTPPYLTIESHTDGQVVHNSTVTITGLVNDIVRGTIEEDQASVSVNGVTASISNRSYMAENIPLQSGENTITVQGVDQVGNSSDYSISLNYQPLVGRHLELVGGQNQTAPINGNLPQPISLKVLDDANQPVVNKNVVFRVIQGSGVVGLDSALEGQGYLAQTDSNGIAATQMRLGQRAGIGNHKVRARVVGWDDEIIFYASATPALGNKLSVNSGNNQRGSVHQPLPAPFVVAVTDEGANTVQGARVRFDIASGSGHFLTDEQSNVQTLERITDSDGRASVQLSLGGVTGLDKQRVTATLLDAQPDSSGNTPVITAGFTASGFVPGDPGDTRISGVVLDNQDKPLPGVTIRVDGTTRQSVSDAEGQFTIDNAPVGPVHLIADGSTTTAEGEFPALSYNIVTVSGVDNPLSAPIYMVKLNMETAKWAGAEDVVITLPEVPGFKLEIPAGSVTFPDGSTEGFVSVTAVNSSKVPMAPPNGMQPQFIVTIQPTGALFDAPAKLTLPNVDGHKAGAQVEMFSYDHDLEEFVAIGLGTVSKNATTITTNPGVGVVKAGWHCGAQPGGDGCCEGGGDCGYCYDKTGDCPSNCELAKDRPAEEQVLGNCQTELCGGSEDNNADVPEDDCGICADGKPAVDEDKPLPAEKQKPDDCKELLCGDNFNPVDETAALQASEPCKLCSEGELDNAPDKTACSGDTPETECYTCKEGACGNQCEPSNVTHTVSSTAPDYVLNAVTKFASAASSSPIFSVSLAPSFDAKETFGEECCKSCLEPGVKAYSKFHGSVGLKGTFQATIPGVGIVKKFPDKPIAGGLVVSGSVFLTAAGGKGSFKSGGGFDYKESLCDGGDCGSITLGTNLNVAVGLFVEGSVSLKSCGEKNCPNLVAVEVEGSIALQASGDVGTKGYSSECDKEGCWGLDVNNIEGVVTAMASFEVFFKKYAFSYEEHTVFYEGGSFGLGCN